MVSVLLGRCRCRLIFGRLHITGAKLISSAVGPVAGRATFAVLPQFPLVSKEVVKHLLREISQEWALAILPWKRIKNKEDINEEGSLFSDSRRSPWKGLPVMRSIYEIAQQLLLPTAASKSPLPVPARLTFHLAALGKVFWTTGRDKNGSRRPNQKLQPRRWTALSENENKTFSCRQTPQGLAAETVRITTVTCSLLILGNSIPRTVSLGEIVSTDPFVFTLVHCFISHLDV